MNKQYNDNDVDKIMFAFIMSVPCGILGFGIGAFIFDSFLRSFGLACIVATVSPFIALHFILKNKQ